MEVVHIWVTNRDIHDSSASIDGCETTGECGVSIYAYMVCMIYITHMSSGNDRAVFAETQWLTADDVIWKVFFYFYFYLYSFTAPFPRTYSWSVHQWNFKKVPKQDGEKTVCNAKIRKLLLETNTSQILLYTVFKYNIDGKHFTIRWHAIISWRVQIMLYYIHVLIYCINIHIDFTRTFIAI